MAFANVDPLARIWQSLGVNYILSEKPVGTKQTKSAIKPPAPVAAPTQKINRRARILSQTPGSASANTQVVTQAPVDSWAPTPLSQWPAQWRDLFENAKKARFAWTYWELGEDLLAGTKKMEALKTEQEESRSARREGLKRLFASLRHPAGTHTFWPMCLSPEEMGKDVNDEMEYFWSGLEFLKCRGVIILGGPAARKILGRDNLKPLTQELVNGKLVWILWDLNIIAKDDRVFGRVSGFLKQALKNFV